MAASAEAESLTLAQALRTIADRIDEGWEDGVAVCILEKDGMAHVCTFDGGDGSRALMMLMAVGSELARSQGVAH